MQRFSRAIVLAAVVAGGVFGAANLSGRWTGEVEVTHEGATPIRTPVQVRLKQDGEALTGTIGREGDEEQANIQNGRVQGSKVSFEATSSETSGPVRFQLTLKGDRLTGEMSGAVAQGNISGHVTLTRAHDVKP